MNKFEFTIEHLTTIDDGVLEAMKRLTAVLRSSNQATLTDEYLERVVANDAVTVLIARLDDDTRTIIGMQSLIVYALPTNVRAILENGAVDPGYEGNGVVSSLIREAISVADSNNVNSVRTSIGALNDAAQRVLTKSGFVPEDGYRWFEYDIKQGNRF